MCGASRHALGALSVPRWEKRTVFVYGVVSLPVPRNEIGNGLSAVAIDGDGTADFSAFDDASVEKEIGDGGVVLVDISDG